MSPRDRQDYTPAAPTALAIKIVTGVVLAMNVGFLVGGFWARWAFVPAALMAVMSLGCYLRAPVGYAASRRGLTIVFRLGTRSFGPVLKAALIQPPIGISLRLWGNGGMFAGTGIFWNRTWGIFRAYVTTSSREYLVLVETHTGKVLVSPDDPEELIRACSE